MFDEDEDSFQFVDGREPSDDVLVKLIPRKANGWIFATIAAEFTKNVLSAATAAMDDITTVFSQRYNYQQDRDAWSSEVGYDIEHIEDFLAEEEDRDACAE
jgi:hypothetical protein